MPGIAAATGTVLDSAAKHTMACKVDEEKMHVFAEADNIINNKHKYCVNRHELVLNTGNVWKTRSGSVSSAYPLIVSNMGDLHEDVKLFVKAAYASLQTAKDLGPTLKFLNDTKPTDAKDAKIKNQLTTLPFCHVQGYSLGVAYANHRQGDIVCAVQVGGMVSVRNGHFPCNTGDMVQWYFDWEKDMFYAVAEGIDNEAGQRKEQAALRTVIMTTNANANYTTRKQAVTAALAAAPAAGANRQQAARQAFAARELGMSNGKINVPYPKPYVVSKTHGEHYGDQIRVFAKCVNGGRAHDMIDVMLMTQSL
jgi:hypothetical protein